MSLIDRENKKFESGAYKRVPWHGEPWFKVPEGDPRALHFVHISERDPYMLAYMPDATLDRRVPIKPGRYLQKFFANELTAEAIRAWASKVKGDGMKLHFTENYDVIRKIYRAEGLGACMSHSDTHYRCFGGNGGLHPVAAYSTGSDLQLAYAKDPEGRVVARALVWPEKKLYSRCYGDHESMKRALEAEGWAYGLLDGAKLRVLPVATNGGPADKPYLTVPYIDHIKWARYDHESKTLTLQTKATGATHSVQHGDGIGYPIEKAPGRPAGNTGEMIHSEWLRLVALEAGGAEPEKGGKAPEPAQQQNNFNLQDITDGAIALARAVEARRQLDAYFQQCMLAQNTQQQLQQNAQQFWDNRFTAGTAE